ncbi:UNVERIFIED_CONTAM: hypothetical protein NCL1_64041 [Trichonephila clavipes]
MFQMFASLIKNINRRHFSLRIQ